MQDAKGRWTGIDADFCRAVAAAALGDADKVTFVSLRASARFPALRGGQVDLLSRNTSWTMLREAGLKIQFVGVLYYDGQGFMVPAKSHIKTAAALKGATVCVEKGTTSARHLEDYSGEQGLAIKPLVIDSAIAVADAFFAGKCRPSRPTFRSLQPCACAQPAGRRPWRYWPSAFRKNRWAPQSAPATTIGSRSSAGAVRLIGLEEAGVTRENFVKRSNEPGVKRAIEVSNDVNKLLGIGSGWGVRVLQSVGNYGEMYQRNLGAASPLKIERGLNRLWTQGGLMYAPPLR